MAANLPCATTAVPGFFFPPSRRLDLGDTNQGRSRAGEPSDSRGIPHNPLAPSSSHSQSSQPLLQVLFFPFPPVGSQQRIQFGLSWCVNISLGSSKVFAGAAGRGQGTGRVAQRSSEASAVRFVKPTSVITADRCWEANTCVVFFLHCPYIIPSLACLRRVKKPLHMPGWHNLEGRSRATTTMRASEAFFERQKLSCAPIRRVNCRDDTTARRVNRAASEIKGCSGSRGVF